MPAHNVGRIDRNISAWKCECGGYSEPVNSTEAECKEHGCGRDTPGNECCAASFVCVICQKRYVGKFEAPEMRWD